MVSKRNIKFRVYDTIIKKYISWESLQFVNFEAKDYIFEQLVNSSENEIYEGDVVEIIDGKTNRPAFTGNVYFSPSQFCYVVYGHDYNGKIGEYAFGSPEIYVKVIGNIHEDRLI